MPTTEEEVMAEEEALSSLADIYGEDLGDEARAAAIKESGGGAGSAVALGLAGLGRSMSRGYGKGGGGESSRNIMNLMQKRRGETGAEFDKKRKFAVNEYLRNKAMGREDELYGRKRTDALSDWERQKEHEMNKLRLKSRLDRETKGPKLTLGQKKVEEKLAKEYADWTTQGASNVAKNLRSLRGVLGRLAAGENLTGGILGRLPDWMKQAVGKGEAVDARELVEGVVQQNLKATLGGQFSEREGEQLIKRAYNDNLSDEENMRRLQLLIDQIDMAAKAKNSLAAYYEANDTFVGWKGVPGMSAGEWFSMSPKDFLADYTEDELTGKADTGETVHMMNRAGKSFWIPKSKVSRAKKDGLVKVTKDEPPAPAPRVRDYGPGLM
jgi:hypothetical protein